MLNEDVLAKILNSSSEGPEQAELDNNQLSETMI